MKKRKNKALALLAGLGIMSSASVLTNAPIQAITQATSQIHTLTTGEIENSSLFAKMDELTALVREINETTYNNIKAITTDDLEKLQMISVMLELSFDVLKRIYTEDELYTICYKSARPFADEKNYLRSLIGMAKAELGLIKKEIPTIWLEQEELDTLTAQIDEKNRQNGLYGNT